MARLLPVCAGVRRWGSAALDLAYVAAGRYEGILGTRAAALGHVGAGLVILREAGGLVEAIGPGGNPLARRRR
jgi:myo-inositol-1(or 4)-monophosphatase